MRRVKHIVCIALAAAGVFGADVQPPWRAIDSGSLRTLYAQEPNRGGNLDLASMDPKVALERRLVSRIGRSPRNSIC